MSTRRLLPILALLAAPISAMGQGLDYVKSHYTKYEHKVPMRDGKTLFTSVYVPKDATEKYPILLQRTPYSVAPSGEDKYKGDLGPSPLFGKEGYIFAYQDVRGRLMSEGEFVNMRPIKEAKVSPEDIDESTDTFDTIDWLVKNIPNNSGKVGQYGISYPGFYTAAGMIDAHPALLASSPQAPVTDWFIGDDFHHNGAFFLPHCFNFLAIFGHPRPAPTTGSNTKFDHGTPDGYKFFMDMGPLANADKKYLKGDVAFCNEIMAHPNYDEFWKARNLRSKLKNIKPSVMTVGGWFDAENLFGALEVYRNVERTSPGTQNTLVMGPWFHGGWSRGDGSSLGDAQFNGKTAEYYRENIEFPFFQEKLKGKGEAKLPEAFVFETGSNVWRKYDAWPPKGVAEKSIYLREEGKIAFDAPTAEGRDEYVSDPAHPVNFIETVSTGMEREYMTADQRFAARRPDVLVYQTEPLDKDLTISGPVGVDLTVSTSGTDSDWVVKLIDVYPEDEADPRPNPTKVKLGGYQQMIRGDVMRGKFREGFDKPKAFTPDEPTPVGFTMPDTCHTFRKGHRLMVQVQSSWFPLVDRNPQTFVDIYAAKESDFKKATQRVYHAPGKASRLKVLAMPG